MCFSAEASFTAAAVLVARTRHLDEVIKTRNAAIAAHTPAAPGRRRELAHWSAAPTVRAGGVNPNLKTNATFQQREAEFAHLEQKIAAARRFFNSAVQKYNTGRPVHHLVRLHHAYTNPHNE